MKVFCSGIIFFFSFLCNIHAQEVIINGTHGERLLEWKDFQGKPDGNSDHEALTYWSINYGFSGVEFKDEQAILKGMEVTLRFEQDKSWVKQVKSDHLLKHEQGHFDIGRLCQLEIMATVRTTNFTKDDFKSQIKAIFKNAMEKYHDLGVKYDKETNHSINKEKQEEWNKFLPIEKERLLKLNQ